MNAGELQSSALLFTETAHTRRRLRVQKIMALEGPR